MVGRNGPRSLFKLEESLEWYSDDFRNAIKRISLGVYFTIFYFGEGSLALEATFEVNPVLTISL